MDEDNLLWIMTTEQGRQFVAELLDLCGAGALGGTGNYAQDFFSMGRRSVGEDLLRIIRSIEAVETDGLALEYKMLREHKNRNEEEDL
jgi:hypothetical protein